MMKRSDSDLRPVVFSHILKECKSLTVGRNSVRYFSILVCFNPFRSALPSLGQITWSYKEDSCFCTVQCYYNKRANTTWVPGILHFTFYILRVSCDFFLWCSEKVSVGLTNSNFGAPSSKHEH